MAQDLGPLDWRIAITDSGGRPTPEFQRRWNTQRSNNGLIGTTVGSGPPPVSPTPLDGAMYADSSTTPYTLYVSFGGTWHQVSAMTFLQLLDTPNSYTSQANKLVKVNSTPDGLEFTSISGVLDLLGNVEGDVLYRSATGWVVLPPGTAGQLLSTGGPAADPSWVDPPAPPSTTGGLGFNAGGLYLNNENLGSGVFGTDITFTNGDPKTVVEALLPATATAVLTINTIDYTTGTITQVGTITFAAGGKIGTVAWSSSPYTLPTGTIINIDAPATADTSLGSITAVLNGVSS